LARRSRPRGPASSSIVRDAANGFPRVKKKKKKKKKKNFSPPPPPPPQKPNNNQPALPALSIPDSSSSDGGPIQKPFRSFGRFSQGAMDLLPVSRTQLADLPRDGSARPQPYPESAREPWRAAEGRFVDIHALARAYHRAAWRRSHHRHGAADQSGRKRRRRRRAVRFAGVPWAANQPIRAIANEGSNISSQVFWGLSWDAALVSAGLRRTHTLVSQAAVSPKTHTTSMPTSPQSLVV